MNIRLGLKTLIIPINSAITLQLFINNQNIMNGFKKIKPTFTNADRVWQKKVAEDVYINIYNYESGLDDGEYGYEVEFQLNENIFKDKAVNFNIFSYKKLDFKQMEKDALKIINKLL